MTRGLSWRAGFLPAGRPTATPGWRRVSSSLRLWCEEGGGEHAGEPVPVARGCPSSLDDEEFPEFGGGEGPQDVAGFLDGGVGGQVTAGVEVAGELAHPGEPLLLDLVPYGGGRGVAAGGVPGQEVHRDGALGALDE